jgi:2-dehydropantoate 2-reductase
MKIAVAGAGAVGCYFGGLLAKAGHDVTLIGRARHVEAIRRDGLRFEKGGVVEMISVGASEEIDAARGAELILVSVKTLDTAATGVALKGVSCKVISLQNGVDNAEQLCAAGLDAHPCVVYVGCSMAGPGHVFHTGRGDLAVGPLLREQATVFEAAGIPCRVTERIDAELWRKLILNCAYNALSALTRCRYGQIAEFEGTRRILIGAVEETIAVANAIGITFDEDMVAASIALAGPLHATVSSTAQDIALGRKTEIDSLNGYVARRGRELGVATPVNEMLRALVKLRESAT